MLQKPMNRTMRFVGKRNDAAGDAVAPLALLRH
jgi:hypothetical protein